MARTSGLSTWGFRTKVSKLASDRVVISVITWVNNAHHTVLHTGRRKDTFSDLPVRSRGVPNSVGVYVTQAKILRIVFSSTFTSWKKRILPYTEDL